MTQRRADKVAKADLEPARQVAHGEVSLPKAVAQVEGKKPAKADRRSLEVDADEAPAQPLQTPAESSAHIPAAKKAPAADDASEVIDGLNQRLAEANERIEELQGNVQALMADNEGMAKVFEANDQLAAATGEAARLRAEVSGLRERINGLLNEKNEAIRLTKHWRGHAERAEKSLGAVQAA